MPTSDRINSVADARRLARRVLPRVIFDYVDGGAEDEVTMGENERAFREISFRPRMALRTPEPGLEATVLGIPLALPVLLAPCGLVRLMHPDGATGVARAARRAGTVSILSAVAGSAPEDLSGEPGPRWFQLYAATREMAGTLIKRATDSGFEGLMVTVDTPALGKRERDIRNGVPTPLRLDPRSAIQLGSQVFARPGWAYRMARSGIAFRRRANPAPAMPGAGKVAMTASPFSWDDVEWIRERWTGPLLVKGVLSGEDAAAAAGAGADAVVVSNHGGRQLEGAPATVRVLPEVVDAVGSRIEVLVDGGIRRGGDVVKALALGARAVLIGRPYLYGLAACGQSGVEKVLEVLRSEMTRTMILLGCGSASDLDGSWLRG